MASMTASLIGVLAAAAAPAAEPPRVADDRLAFELFAESPRIVTPTGIAVDPRGRAFAIESHTHFRPKDYDGPPADRIRVFEDTDGDGKADRVSTFYEGSKHTMALAFEPDGDLVVATRAGIFWLTDKDGDGQADGQPVTLVRLETRGDYPHNGLAGVALDFEGGLWFGLGENLGEPYRLIGGDGKTLSGGGEGGNIYRMDRDGTGLRRVATGFWNPFALAFDPFGRLFAVDNDPDSRPPCRLLHIVEGGDYGFKFRNGRKGLHPFSSWNGELPGTLPMVAGTGEAPSGLLVYEGTNLPADYRGTLLGTSWGDHRIERYRLVPHGASFRSTMEPVVIGGEDFRPVGIAKAPDGSLYLTDWVRKDYELHGQGRIWRLRGKEARPPDNAAGIAAVDRDVRESAARELLGTLSSWAILVETVRTNREPRARSLALQALMETGSVQAEAVRTALADLDVGVRLTATRSSFADLAAVASSDRSSEVRAEAMRRLEDAKARETLIAALDSDDPFLHQAATAGLAGSLKATEMATLLDDERPRRRLGALLALRQIGTGDSAAILRKALSDPDPDVRFVAVEWVAEAGLGEFKETLRQGLADPSLTRTLFEAYLAALERLDGRGRPLGQEVGGQEYIAALVTDPATPPEVLRRAVRSLRPDHPALSIERVGRWLTSPDAALRREAVRSLRDAPHERRSDLLASLARDDQAQAALRAEAIAGLRPGTDLPLADLVDLAAGDGPPEVRRAAARTLRGADLPHEQAERLRGSDVGRTYRPDGDDRPSADDIDGWLARLDAAGPADPAEGQRVFFHPNGPGCYRCHRVDGRGGNAGPELTIAAPALTRRRLVESIVQPSKEVAPQFVPWVIARRDGTVATGLLIEEAIDGRQTYADPAGATFTLLPEEIAERRPSPGSLMPDDLTRRMTVEELRDVAAFLLGLSP